MIRLLCLVSVIARKIVQRIAGDAKQSSDTEPCHNSRRRISNRQCTLQWSTAGLSGIKPGAPMLCPCQSLQTLARAASLGHFLSQQWTEERRQVTLYP